MMKLIASGDSFVDESSPDSIHGRDETMSVRGSPTASRNISFVRFDLGAIPQGSTVQSVELDLHANSMENVNEAEISISAAGKSWDESTLTWNTRPPEETGFVMSRVQASSGYLAWSSSEFPALAAKVQGWVENPSSNNGFEVCLGASDNVRIDYFTRESTNSAWRPTMAIVYLPPPDGTGDSITGLAASTSNGGNEIRPDTWQTDNDPYFHWNVPAANSSIVGYSVAIDTLPDDTVDVTAPCFQCPADELANGGHTFYVKSLDAAGNWGPPASFVIKVDRETPFEPAICINKGSIVTWSPIVKLTGISAKDSYSGVAGMRFSNDGRTWSDWEPYASNRVAWDLSAFGGDAATNTPVSVSVQFLDLAGNTSHTAIATIRLIQTDSRPLPPSNLRVRQAPSVTRRPH